VLNASAQMIALDLAGYGEDQAAEWIVSCSDEDLVRVCSVVGWIAENGPGTASGGTLLAKACAMAAVYVREGRPRELVRSRRRRVDPKLFPGDRRPPLFAEGPALDGVGEDLRSFWN
jgi:hypothetical protein